jgi:hypothetical protein
MPQTGDAVASGLVASKPSVTSDEAIQVGALIEFAVARIGAEDQSGGARRRK